MIPLEDAQTKLLALARQMPAETVDITEAAGRWTAQDVFARRTQPACDLSAMDGYALRGGSQGPWRVVGESSAGKPFEQFVGSGEAVRIFTGAALPPGTDGVLIQENAVREGETVSTAEPPPAGLHVRRQGGDFETGDRLIGHGMPLTPARLALAIAGGHGALSVRRRPRVAILSTGDELVPPGEDAGQDRLPESNSLMLAAMLGGMADVRRLEIVRDALAPLVSAIRAVDADVLITIGGASVGDYDLVGPALAECGAEMEFLKVAMRPGKPMMAGRLAETIVIGLPGNPVSAYVTSLLFAVPLLRAMLGSPSPLPMIEHARAAAPLPANGPRLDHVRAILEEGGVRPVGINDSAALRALACTDCLIRRNPHATEAVVGEDLEIIRL